jgi:hypothetical protein
MNRPRLEVDKRKTPGGVMKPNIVGLKTVFRSAISTLVVALTSPRAVEESAE